LAREGSRISRDVSETSCVAWVSAIYQKPNAPRCQVTSSAFPACGPQGGHGSGIRFGQQDITISHYGRASLYPVRCWICSPRMFSQLKLSNSLDIEFCLEALEIALPLGEATRSSTPIKGCQPFQVVVAPPSFTCGILGYEEASSGRLAVRSNEGKIPSPGRPSTASAQASSLFWMAIAQGLSSEKCRIPRRASLKRIGTPLVPQCWRDAFRRLNPPFGPFPVLSEREEIAILWAKNLESAQLPRELVASASTILPKLRRNSQQRQQCVAIGPQRHSGMLNVAPERPSPKVARLAGKPPA